MNMNAPANLQQLSALLRQGEGPSPKYEEIGGFVVVTFKVRAGSTARIEIPLRVEKRRLWPGQSQVRVKGQSRFFVILERRSRLGCWLPWEKNL